MTTTQSTHGELGGAIRVKPCRTMTNLGRQTSREGEDPCSGPHGSQSTFRETKSQRVSASVSPPRADQHPCAARRTASPKGHQQEDKYDSSLVLAFTMLYAQPQSAGGRQSRALTSRRGSGGRRARICSRHHCTRSRARRAPLLFHPTMSPFQCDGKYLYGTDLPLGIAHQMWHKPPPTGAKLEP
jgi:hypothetical protein